MGSLARRSPLLLTMAVAWISSLPHGFCFGPREKSHERGSSPIPNSDCLSVKTAEECRETSASLLSRCVWCVSKAVPSQCVPPDIAVQLPKLVFNCFDYEEPADNKDPADDAADVPTVAEVTHENEAIESRHKEIFEAWKQDFGVSYASDEEEARRMLIFKESLHDVIVHNAASSFVVGAEAATESKSGERHSPLHYSLGLNRFSDMTWEEFKESRLGMGSPLSASQNCSATHFESQYRALGLSTGRSPPPTRDWRDLGAVSIVKDQEHCGSCWTFSTTGALESHHYLRNGEMLLLSEQQLLDCAGAYDNHGCNGGLPSHAFEYIASAGGLDTEEAYPYLAEESGSCSFAEKGIGADVMRSVNITFQDEAELLEAVGNTGPVSVAFQVASDFKAYAGGVYDNPSCSTLPEQVNHAVLCVGYGTTEDGVDYWIIKNSWGSDWGDDGFFRMARGKNMCGVADCASFPLVP